MRPRLVGGRSAVKTLFHAKAAIQSELVRTLPRPASGMEAAGFSLNSHRCARLCEQTCGEFPVEAATPQAVAQRRRFTMGNTLRG